VSADDPTVAELVEEARRVVCKSVLRDHQLALGAYHGAIRAALRERMPYQRRQPLTRIGGPIRKADR
jgi:hypothetical protein